MSLLIVDDNEIFLILRINEVSAALETKKNPETQGLRFILDSRQLCVALEGQLTTGSRLTNGAIL